MRRAVGAVAAKSSTYFALGQRARMSRSAARSLPASASARPAKPRGVTITSAMPNGQGWKPYEIVSPSPPAFHSPGDIASWVTNKSCSRPGPDKPTS